MKNYQRPEINISTNALAGIIVVGVIIFLVVVFGSQATAVVEPGNRGVRVTLGKVSPDFEQEGFLIKPPFITSIHQVSIRQQTEELHTECYSADLQQVKVDLRILYRVPEGSVVTLFQSYQGDPFATLVAPRVVEALKEVASTQSAEMIVQNREKIKIDTLALTRSKIGEKPGGGPLLIIEDIALSDLTLSPELNAAIEQKMTQRQEAERAKFVQKQAEIEAETMIIKARGEGESFQIRGKALRDNPAFVRWQIVDKWDGVSPLIVGGNAESGTQVMVPMDSLERKTP